MLNKIASKSQQTKQFAAKVLKRLKKHWPDAECSLSFESSLQLLVATILSAQCTDVRVNQVTGPLFKKYRTAADFANADLEELETAIQSTGFYHNKAKNIQESCRIIDRDYAGKVPENLDELIELPGVGRKTANVVLANAFGIVCGVVVDTHVSRLAGRIGLSSEKTPEKIEQDLMNLYPKKSWTELSHLLIQLGRSVCRARKPDCDHCPLADICPQIFCS